MADIFAERMNKALGGGLAIDNRQVLSADGSTSAVAFVGQVWLSLSGNFGGGTARLQSRDPSSANVALANGAFTAATDTLFDFPAAPNILNVSLTSASGPALVVRFQSSQ